MRIAVLSTVISRPVRSPSMPCDIPQSHFKFDAFAYCVMPDHVHFVAQGRTASSNVSRFVSQGKQRTAYLLRREVSRGFWQRGCWDHMLRRAGDCENLVWYAWMNPVRRGIVGQPEDYARSGAFPGSWPKASPPSILWVPPWQPLAGRAEAWHLQMPPWTNS